MLSLGSRAMPGLKQAESSGDAEVKSRAAELRRVIEAKAEPAVQAATARLLAKLKPGGELRIATDHPIYLEWTLSVMARHTAQFEWLAEKPSDFLEPPSGWIETRYGAKSRREGRRPYYLRYRRL